MKRIALLVLAAGCMTTRTVPRSQLASLENRRVGDGAVLKTTEVWKTRLDPTSKIRFRNAAGSWSDWLEGNKIYVAPEGVYTPATVDLFDYAVTIEIRDMGAVERHALATSRPDTDAELRIEPDGTAIVIARGQQLHRWVNSFLEVINSLHDYNELRYTMNGKPLGEWTFVLPYREPVVAAGEALYEQLDAGLATRKGWRWKDIDGAEVKSLSGGLTLGAIVGVSALAVVVVPFAMLAGGGGGRLFPGDGPRTGGSFSSRSLGNSDLWKIGSGGGAASIGNWQPVLADEQALSAPNLFSGSARRKAMFRMVASAEASLGSVGGHALLDGGAAVMRIGGVFELGAGGLHVARFDGDRLWHGGIAFARIGANLPLDAAHRVSLPLSLDLGGGGGEALGVFTRLNWGVRVALPHEMFLGVMPASPTLLNWKHDPGRRRGSLMSGIELGVVW